MKPEEKAQLEMQLIYIKGILVDFDPNVIGLVEKEFNKFLSFMNKECESKDEIQAAGMLVLARYGIQQQINT